MNDQTYMLDKQTYPNTTKMYKAHSYANKSEVPIEGPSTEEMLLFNAQHKTSLDHCHPGQTLLSVV